MATSAFRSTTKRSSIGTADDATTSSSSSNRNATHRRSRSLSRSSGRFQPVDSEDLPAPRGRFVNTVRGSGFPEISLDDLANDFFPLKDADVRESNRGRSGRRTSAISPSTTRPTEPASQRRGRSVSRQHCRAGDAKITFDNSSTVKDVCDTKTRRRRSVSVARCQFSDSESQSSALTDDEQSDARSNKNMIERTIRAVYAQKKSEHPSVDGVDTGLYEAMRKELRHAVEEIRTELEHVTVNARPSALENGDSFQPNNSDVLQAVSLIMKNYMKKMQQSEKRKQDLLAKMMVEEIYKIGREFLPDQNKVVTEKPLRARKRSNDRSKMSKTLTEEAEKYFEDFISNVEDTDISSFDGERSDASSTLGGTTKSRGSTLLCGETYTLKNPARSTSLPVEMDGIVLPWLQWETSNDGSPLSYKSKMEVPVKTQNNSCNAAQLGNTLNKKSNCFTSSRGSEPKTRRFEMDEYHHLKQSEDLLFERWRQRQRISSGGLILCTNFPLLL